MSDCHRPDLAGVRLKRGAGESRRERTIHSISSFFRKEI